MTPRVSSRESSGLLLFGSEHTPTDCTLRGMDHILGDEPSKAINECEKCKSTTRHNVVAVEERKAHLPSTCAQASENRIMAASRTVSGLALSYEGRLPSRLERAVVAVAPGSTAIDYCEAILRLPDRQSQAIAEFLPSTGSSLAIVALKWVVANTRRLWQSRGHGCSISSQEESLLALRVGGDMSQQDRITAFQNLKNGPEHAELVRRIHCYLCYREQEPRGSSSNNFVFESGKVTKQGRGNPRNRKVAALTNRLMSGLDDHVRKGPREYRKATSLRRTGQRLARLVDTFGIAILILLDPDLTVEKLDLSPFSAQHGGC